jgi:CheY-like chemotaxis protein
MDESGIRKSTRSVAARLAHNPKGMPTDGPEILIAEDDVKLRHLLRRALERDGYKVAEAESGDELIEHLARAKPDLIVLDIRLPDADGRDLLARLKRDPATAAIPVVVWSGYHADSSQRIAIELGAEDFVEKGAPSVLVGKIERILLRLSEPNQVV